MSRLGGAFLILLVCAVGATLFVPYLAKASQELRSYRPDAFRTAEAPRDLKSLFHARSIAMKGQRKNVS